MVQNRTGKRRINSVVFYVVHFELCEQCQSHIIKQKFCCTEVLSILDIHDITGGLELKLNGVIGRKY